MENAPKASAPNSPSEFAPGGHARWIAAIMLLLAGYFIHAELAQIEHRQGVERAALFRTLAGHAAAFARDTATRREAIEHITTQIEQTPVLEITVEDDFAEPLFQQRQLNAYEARLPALYRALSRLAGIPARREIVLTPPGAPELMVYLTVSTACTTLETLRVILVGLLLALLAFLAILWLLHRQRLQTRKHMARLNRQFDHLTHQLVPEEFRLQTGPLETRINRLQDVLFEQAARNDVTAQRLKGQSRSLQEELGLCRGEVEECRKALRQATRAKLSFMAHLSHEIRTPMNSIIGFGQLLERTPLNALQRDYLHTMQQSGQSLLGMLGNVLDLTQIENSSLALSPRPFDLVDLLESTVLGLATEAYDKGLDLHLVPYADLPAKAMGDAPRLSQALVNLLGNAIRYTPRGAVTLRALVEDEWDDEFLLRIEVRDTGPGLPFTQREAIERVYLDGRRDEDDSVGLGLYVTYHIVQAMHGQTGYDSEPGQGATFWFTARLRCAGQGKLDDSLPRFGNRRADVLINEPDARLSLRNALMSMNFHVVEHDSLQSLLRQMRQTPADETQHALDLLVIGQLTRRFSPDLARRLVEDLRPHTRHIVALEPTLDPQRLQEVESWGVDRCLPSTIRRERLIAAVEELAQLERASPSAPSTDEEQRRPIPGLRVLAIDDNALNRQVARRLLEQLRCEVLTADSGAEGLRLCSRERQDIIFTDLHMPGMDGIQTLAALRRLPLVDKAPIYAVTADALPETRARLMEAGFDGVLVKPLLERDLIEVLIAHFGASATPVEQAKQPPVCPPTLDEELRELLRAELPEQLAELQTLNAQTEREALRQLAHKIRGSAGCCGLARLLAAATVTEETLIRRESSLQERRASVHTLREEIRRVLDALQY